jgi:large subunit ribosomal protein L18e
MEKIETSKTQIEKRMKKKTNTQLVKTILAVKKINTKYAKMLAYPRRKMITVNVELLEKACKDGEKVLVPGKILGSGALTKKLKVVAFSASGEAQEKIKKAKGDFVEILEEIKKNQKLNDLKVLEYE